MSFTMFQQKLASIEAVDPKLATDPNIPVAQALQEAEDLYVWCQADKDLLTKSGLNWNFVDDLPARTAALRYIQSEWKKESQTLEDAQKEWKERAPGAFALRDELLHHFFRAFRNQPDLVARTQKIAEGAGNADMIQDLSDQAILGKANTQYLKEINVDLSLLDQAETLSDEMASLLARSNGQKRDGNNQIKVIRDKAYAHLKEAVDEIRDAGVALPPVLVSVAHSSMRVMSAGWAGSATFQISCACPPNVRSM